MPIPCHWPSCPGPGEPSQDVPLSYWCEIHAKKARHVREAAFRAAAAEREIEEQEAGRNGR